VICDCHSGELGAWAAGRAGGGEAACVQALELTHDPVRLDRALSYNPSTVHLHTKLGVWKRYDLVTNCGRGVASRPPASKGGRSLVDAGTRAYAVKGTRFSYLGPKK